jgi:plasmid stabilization system protein ParE
MNTNDPHLPTGAEWTDAMQQELDRAFEAVHQGHGAATDAATEELASTIQALKASLDAFPPRDSSGESLRLSAGRRRELMRAFEQAMAAEAAGSDSDVADTPPAQVVEMTRETRKPRELRLRWVPLRLKQGLLAAAGLVIVMAVVMTSDDYIAPPATRPNMPAASIAPFLTQSLESSDAVLAADAVGKLTGQIDDAAGRGVGNPFGGGAGSPFAAAGPAGVDMMNAPLDAETRQQLYNEQLGRRESVALRSAAPKSSENPRRSLLASISDPSFKPAPAQPLSDRAEARTDSTADAQTFFEADAFGRAPSTAPGSRLERFSRRRAAEYAEFPHVDIDGPRHDELYRLTQRGSFDPVPVPAPASAPAITAPGAAPAPRPSQPAMEFSNVMQDSAPDARNEPPSAPMSVPVVEEGFAAIAAAPLGDGPSPYPAGMVAMRDQPMLRVAPTPPVRQPIGPFTGQPAAFYEAELLEPLIAEAAGLPDALHVLAPGADPSGREVLQASFFPTNGVQTLTWPGDVVLAYQPPDIWRGAPLIDADAPVIRRQGVTVVLMRLWLRGSSPEEVAAAYSRLAQALSESNAQVQVRLASAPDDPAALTVRAARAGGDVVRMILSSNHDPARLKALRTVLEAEALRRPESIAGRLEAIARDWAVTF